VKTFHEAFEENAGKAPVMASLVTKAQAPADIAGR
jgi:hypothetical protein